MPRKKDEKLEDVIKQSQDVIRSPLTKSIRKFAIAEAIAAPLFVVSLVVSIVTDNSIALFICRVFSIAVIIISATYCGYWLALKDMSNSFEILISLINKFMKKREKTVKERQAKKAAKK